MKSLLSSLVLILLVSAPTAQDMFLGVEAKSGDRFGQSVAALPDWDGDGCDEIAVGAPSTRSDSADKAGAVRIYSGRTGVLLRTFYGDERGGQFGYAIDHVGITREDGEPMMIIGAPYEDGNGSNAGVVRLVSYQREQGDPTWLEFEAAGSSEESYAGWSVTGLGHPSGSHASFAWGEPGYYKATGFVVAKGVKPRGTGYRNRWWQVGPSIGSWFGFALADAGDLSLDGWSEIAIGAPFADFGGVQDCGRVTVHDLEEGGGVLIQRYGLDGFDWLGWSVASLGDVDGDGQPDVGFGAPYADVGGRDHGMVLVHSGAWPHPQLHQVTGAEPGEFGWALCGVLDHDRNGRADYAVGAPRHPMDGSDPAGLVTIHEGPSGSVRLYVPPAIGARRFGASLSGEGDFNGDGRKDLVIGAPTASFAAPSSGAVYVVYM